MTWYNEVRPHGALELERMQTPIKAFYEKMADPDSLINPDMLAGDETIS
jgi:hypothetical protein